MDVMIKKVIWIGLALSLIGFVSASGARADDLDKETVLTFSQPVEIPGHVLPAGTYTFRLFSSKSDRHIVQVFNADGSQLIATVLAIPDYRLTATDKTVITFVEAPAGSPEVIRAWFYPGNTIGQEFVYSRQRALELAKASNVVVPALSADVVRVDDLATAPIVAVTPDQRDADVNVAIQTTPPEMAASEVGGSTRNAGQLPATASTLPSVLVFGLGCLGLAAGLMVFGRRDPATAR
jgi:hypothetical protein